jgi:hypothetical protein
MTSTLSHLHPPLISAHDYAYHKRQVQSFGNRLWSGTWQGHYSADSAGRSSTRSKNAGRSEGAHYGKSYDIFYFRRHHDNISIVSRSEPQARQRIAPADGNALHTPLAIANHDGVIGEVEPITDSIGPSYTHAV